MTRMPFWNFLPNFYCQGHFLGLYGPPSDRRVPNSQPNHTWRAPNGPVHTGRYATRQTHGHPQIRFRHHSGYRELRRINLDRHLFLFSITRPKYSGPYSLEQAANNIAGTNKLKISLISLLVSLRTPSQRASRRTT